LRRAHGAIDNNPPVVDCHLRQIKVKPFDVGPSAYGLENLLAGVGPLMPVFHHLHRLPCCVAGRTQPLCVRDHFDALVDQGGFKRASDIPVHLRKERAFLLKNRDSRTKSSKELAEFKGDSPTAKND
jgi:hypothetical protein